MRFALRSLRNNPAFAALAVISVGAAIGLAAALSGVAQAIFLRPLPVARPEEILRVFTVSESQPLGFVSYPDFEDLARARAFSGAVAQAQVLVAMGDPPQIALGLAVTVNYFDLLGVHLAVGRGFRPGEARQPVVVLAHSFWESRFGGDPSMIGRIIPLGGSAFRVIGIAPEGFGLERFAHESFYVPIEVYQAGLLPSTGHPLEDRSKRFLSIYARVRPGSMGQARAEIPSIAEALERQYPASNRGRWAIAITEFEARRRGDGTIAALTGLLAGVGVLIAMIGCANLAGLLALRREARSREIAIKIAIGATETRLLLESLGESGAICAGGAVLGAIFASIAARILGSFARLPTDLPFSIHPRIDPPMVIGLALTTAILSGCPGSIPVRNTARWRNAVVTVEIAIATAMTATGGWMLEKIVSAGRIDLGYRADHVLTLALDPAQVRYGETATRGFYDRLLDRVRAMPEVRLAALAQSVPLGYTGAQREVEIGDERMSVWMNVVTPGYFDLLRMPVVEGRAFDDRDAASSPAVTIVNQALAKSFEGSPIGRLMRVNGRGVQVIGVVRTAKYFRPGEPPMPFFYLPYAQNYASRMVLHLKTRGDPREAAPAVISAIRSLDAAQPVSEVRPLGDYFSKGAMFSTRLGVRVMAALAACGLLLAMAGLYGVISQMVVRRRREIGIRMALGAPAVRVIALIVGQGAKLAAPGIAGGCFAAIWISRWIGEGHPEVLFASAALILFASVAACAIPARAAWAVDPAVALRDP